MSEALIIVDGRPNDTLAQVLDAFGVADELGAGWPRADLDLYDGVAINCDDWDKLAELIDARPDGVTAFYAGPINGMDAVDGKSVSHTGRRYQVRRVPPTAALLPYAHRLLSVRRNGIGHEGKSFGRNDPRAAGNLFFSPLSVRVDSDDLTAVGYSGSPINAVMLPPVVQNTKATYFSENLVALRKALIDSLSDPAIEARRPAALALMRLVDSPILRPFLTEGGCLMLRDDVDGVTRVVLEAASADPLPEYRVGFFEALDGSTVGLSAIRGALRGDLLGLSPGLEMRGTRQDHSWGEYELRGRRRGNRSLGSWQLIKLLLKKLGPFMSEDLEARLEDRILDRSAPSGIDYPDHGLAEEALVRDLARIPWAPYEPRWGDSWPRNTSWDEAIVLLLQGSLASEVGVDTHGMPPWETDRSGWEIANGEGRAPLTVYYPRADESQVFRWRLHAPIGAQFLADEWSRIGHGDTMRIGETLRLQ